jgi:carboxyl-terminal processing protease
MSRWNLAWLIGIPAVAMLGLAVSYSAPSHEKDKDYELVRLVVDVLDEVDKNYVRDLSPEAKRKLVEDMINGGLEHLDQHSTYMNPKEYKVFDTQSKGHFGGVGIQITIDKPTGRLMVESPMVGTPAYEAGVRADDVILKIDGKSTKDMTIEDAVDVIKGDKGQKIVLTVQRDGAKEPVDIEMLRDEIKVPTVLGDKRTADHKDWEYFVDDKNKIAYVRIMAFNENTTEELKAVLNKLKAQECHGLVLDLRGNPGGLLSSAVEVSNLFLTEGRIVSTKGRNERERIFDAEAKGALLASAKDCPVVVLVNKYSASASEIVSACLQDHERAVIVGERSYGKGSVQNILRLENGKNGAIKLTTASYWRPSGKNIHRFPDSKETDEWGVKPNPGYEVKLTDEQRADYVVWRRDRDKVYGKPGTPIPAPKPRLDKDGKEKPPFEDKVLNKALEYLRGKIAKPTGGAALPAPLGIG